MQRRQGELDDLKEEIRFECVHYEGYAREGNGAGQGACAREGRAGECAGTAGAHVVMSVFKGALHRRPCPLKSKKCRSPPGRRPQR